MKKLSKLIATAVALLAVSLTGCSNLVDDATIAGETITGSKKVTLTATSDGNIVTFSNGSSRMIMPGTLDATYTDAWKFWLYGTNKTSGTTLTLQEVTFTATGSSTTKGTVNLELDVAEYELYLYMIAGTQTPTTQADAYSKAVLYATASVDFTNGDTVNFYLSPYKLTATGGYSLKVYLDGWTMDATQYTATVGIYNATDNTGTLTEVTGCDSLAYNGTTVFPSSAPATANFVSTSIAAGTYNFIVAFVPISGSGLTNTYYYSDKIVILSNQTTTAEIAIPSVIGVAPATPEALGVSYVDPLTQTQDYYEAEFTWTDNAYNESYFQLELVDFTNVTAADVETSVATIAAATGASDANIDTAWETLVGNTYNAAETIYTFGKTITVVENNNTTEQNDYFYNSPSYWVDGSFNVNSAYAVIKLKLGHRYLARLCAVNPAGKSKYLYADIIGSTVTTTTAYKRFGATEVAADKLSKFGANAMEINRFRITYNLNGGVFYTATTAGGAIPTAASTTSISSTVKGINTALDAVVQYGTQRKTSTDTLLNALYAPTSDNAVFGVLLSGVNRWTDWLYGSSAGNVYTTNYNAKQDADYNATTPAPVPYMEWATSAPSATVYGFSNIDLYATYKVTSGSAYIDSSSDYNIKKEMVKLYHNTSSAFPTTPAETTNKENGVYVYVANATADTNAGSAEPALFLYPALVNDATNNVVNENGISYYKVTFEVYSTAGKLSVQNTTSTATSTIAWTDGETAGGGTSASASFSYVEVPISGLTAGKYTIMIHAYANTQQSEYTYPITFEVRKASE